MKRKTTTPRLKLAEIVNCSDLQFSFFDDIHGAIREMQKLGAKGFVQVGKIFHVRPPIEPAKLVDKYIVLHVKKIPSKTRNVRPYYFLAVKP